MQPNEKQPRYTVVIQWSEEDQTFIASLPEWGPYCHAQGATYEAAASNAHQVLQLLMEDEFGKPVDLPPEKLFHYPGADVVNMPEPLNHSRSGKPALKTA